MQATNQTVQRYYNRALVLRQIRSDRRTSRVELSRVLGLKKSSISNIVGDLLQTGIVLEREQGESTLAGGRRPIYLEIQDQFCSFLGVEVQPNRFSAALVDLNGKVLHTWNGKTSTYQLGFEKAVGLIFEELAQDIDAGFPPLAGICLGVPGFVNPWTSEILFSIPHGLEHFAVRSIENPWGVPVFAENDANCCAWGELMLQKSGPGRDFLAILSEFQEENPRLHQDVGVSTGFGVVLNGRLHYGKQFNAGEFRSFDWKSSRKGQVGISDLDLLRIQRDSEVLDRYLLEVLQNLVPIISVLQPEKIVFCGDGRALVARIPSLVAKHLPESYLAEEEVAELFVESGHPTHPVAIGAAGRLLEVLFQRPSLSAQNAGLGIGWDQIFEMFTNPVK